MGINRIEKLRRTAAAILIDELADLVDEPVTPSAIRRWIYNNHGLKSRSLMRVDPGFVGAIVRDRQGIAIEYAAELPVGKQIRVLIHELAEYMQGLEHGNLFDGMPGFVTGYTGGDCPADAHHDVARRVENHFANVMSLDTGPSSLGPAGLLRVLQGPGCPDRYTYDGGHPDTIGVDALADACI